MADGRRVTTILQYGTYSFHFGPKLRADIDALGATPRLLAQATVEFNRSTYTEPTKFGRDGVKDFSPRPSDIQMAIGHAGNDEYAAKNRSAWEPLVTRVNSQIVQVYLQNRIKDGEGLIVLGYKTGHGGPAEAALFDLKTRLPDQFTVLLSNLPHDADGRERLREGYDRFSRYKEEGLIEVCLLTDNSSPLATRLFDLYKQDWYIAKALASLLAGQVHFTTNRSLAEVGRTLGEYSAFAGLSFASRGLAWIIHENHPMASGRHPARSGSDVARWRHTAIRATLVNNPG